MMKSIKYCLIAFLTLSLLGSCVKKEARENNFDAPAAPALPIGTVYTIQALLEMHETQGDITFTEDASVYGVVTCDETSGNLYKAAFIQDGLYGIELYMEATSGLRIGDSVCVYLKGATLSDYEKTPQIQDLNPSNVTILANGLNIVPDTIKFSQASIYLCCLVSIDSVEFDNPSYNYADAEGYGIRSLNECGTNETIVVRTSNYASFADTKLPDGNGTITGIITRYKNEMQLLIRTPNEVLLNGPRCDE